MIEERSNEGDEDGLTHKPASQQFSRPSSVSGPAKGQSRSITRNSVLEKPEIGSQADSQNENFDPLAQMDLSKSVVQQIEAKRSSAR